MQILEGQEARDYMTSVWGDERGRAMADMFGSTVFVVPETTRAEQIEDGALIEAGPMAKEAGIKIPVCLTRALWEDVKAIPEAHSHQDVNGRLWDVLSMFRFNAARNPNTSEILYRLIMHVGRKTYYTVKAVIGPGDDGDPVITLMKPGEEE